MKRISRALCERCNTAIIFNHDKQRWETADGKWRCAAGNQYERTHTAIPDIPSFSVSAFTGDGYRSWVAERSDLCGPLRARRPLYGQVWADSGDMGFWLTKGNQRILMLLRRVDVNDGDVIGWRFEGVEDMVTYEALVIND